MSDIRATLIPPRQTLLVPGLLVVAALLLVVGSAFAVDFSARVMLLAGASTLLMLLLLQAIFYLRKYQQRRQMLTATKALFAGDRACCYITNDRDHTIWQNHAADVSGQSDPFSQTFADPVSRITELRTLAARDGMAEWHAPGEDGALVVIRDLGGGMVLWQFGLAEKAFSEALPGDILWAKVSEDGTILQTSPGFRAEIGADLVSIRDIIDGDVEDGVATRLRVKLEDTLHEMIVTRSGARDGAFFYVFIHDIPTRAVSGSESIEGLPVPIARIDREGGLVAANKLARALLNISPDEECAFPELVEGLGRPVSDWLADSFDGRVTSKPEVVRASRAQTDLYIQITLGQIGSGEEAQLVAVLHDATELKTLEAQFVQSQKMQAIGQLAGGVAHDFNNLLTAISGHCDLLLLRHDPGDQDFADLEQINQNANRAASLVGQLLAFSRKQNMRPEPLDLRDTLSDLTHLLNRLVGETVDLTFHHDPDLQMVRADKRQLEQVIMNLVVNARDAMSGGGRVTIETDMRTLSSPMTRDRVTVPTGTYVIVRVRDEGHGISEDKLQKIFEPFFTTKRTGEGTGLGLSTAYGIIKQSGGYIFADSQVGTGTVFSLYFPAHKRRAAAPVVEQAAPRLSQTRAQGVILLVEDEAPVRAFAARALQMQGYTVLEAVDADDALGQLTDSELHVDVFVTDVIMPGKDGPTWVREALVDRPETRVVFMSGYAEESFAENQAQIPNSVFLPKPFSLRQLTQTVQDQVD